MKIGVIGLGLIGGSIYKDLTELGYEVVGISQSQKGKNIYSDYDYLKDCSLVFICCAMNKVMEVLDKLENYISSETVVTDVSSIKSFVCSKKRPYNFVPSHPMAGTEKQGFENSFCGMFKGAKWVITPFQNSEIPQILINIIKELGAKPIITNAQEHDRAVALISHMPMLISQAIFKTAQNNPLAMDIASSGFRDMTRLSMSNTEMANDMIIGNAEYIQQAILSLYKSVGELTSSDYKNQIEIIRKERQKMFV